MAKHVICEIDAKVNSQKTICSLERSLRNIEKYIIKYIDSNFDINGFRVWLNSDDDKPFRCNKHTYYWQ